MLCAPARNAAAVVLLLSTTSSVGANRDEDTSSLFGYVSRELQEDSFAQAIAWQTNDTVSAANPASADQRLALANLYYSTGGPDWSNNTGWLTDSPECEWYSSAPDNEACDANGTYVSLNLTNNGLEGPFESTLDAVLALERIVRLDVGFNELTGSIPSELGLATSLAFFIINDNSINSTIPTEVGSVSLLRQFSAQSNDLEGPIPSEFADPALSNNLEGTIPLEIANASFATLGGVRRLRDMNSFSGTVPRRMARRVLRELQEVDELGPVGLRRLEVDDNPRMNGTLPPEIGLIPTLEVFTFNNTGIDTTDIPSTYCDITGVRLVDFCPESVPISNPVTVSMPNPSPAVVVTRSTPRPTIRPTRTPTVSPTRKPSSNKSKDETIPCGCLPASTAKPTAANTTKTTTKKVSTISPTNKGYSTKAPAVAPFTVPILQKNTPAPTRDYLAPSFVPI